MVAVMKLGKLEKDEWHTSEKLTNSKSSKF